MSLCFSAACIQLRWKTIFKNLLIILSLTKTHMFYWTEVPGKILKRDSDRTWLEWNSEILFLKKVVLVSLIAWRVWDCSLAFYHANHLPGTGLVLTSRDKSWLTHHWWIIVSLGDFLWIVPLQIIMKRTFYSFSSINKTQAKKKEKQYIVTTA